MRSLIAVAWCLWCHPNFYTWDNCGVIVPAARVPFNPQQCLTWNRCYHCKPYWGPRR